MRGIIGKMLIVVLLLNYSCINRRIIIEKAPILELHELEVQYALEHPDALEKIDIESDLAHIVRHYIDTVGLDYLFQDLPVKKNLQEEIRDFYGKTGYRLVWNSSIGALPVSSELIGALGEAYRYGLDPGDYNPEEIIERQRSVFQHGTLSRNLKSLLALDIFMTSRYILLGYHINAGRIDPVEVLEDWYIETETRSISDKLAEGWAKGDLSSALAGLEPELEEYRLLKEYFLRYFNIIKSSKMGFHVPEGLTVLKPGDTSRYLKDVKTKLILLGDLDGDPDHRYDKDLELAITKFQVRHGLDQDGVLGSETLKQLNVSFQERLHLIGINLERTKWFPELNDRYIMVNVPDFTMSLYENKKKKLEMKAIVGKDVNPTPVMSEDLTYIVFNPTWTVPYSIATKELLPKIKEDIGFLGKNNYLVYDGWGKNAHLVDPKDVDWDEYDEENFPYVLVQQPGPGNALGKVQFMMPNNLAIYLHDTPAGYLFGRDERAFSHGCVRLERPLELAEYLLNDKSGWDNEKITEALSREEPVEAILPEKWPVHILYKTAWIDEEGLLNFRDDIYGLDSAHFEAIDRLDLSFPMALEQ
jgi:L,D-transpeptidase YcbB